MKKFTRGAVAGAAGTTALNAIGYADMALRGRPASSVPARVAEQLARRVGGAIPGNDAARQNRLEGLGALAGIATGAGVGALAGQWRGAVRRLGPVAGPAVIGGAAMLPGTPSRLDPPGLTGRLVSASLAAAVLARSEHRGPIPSMLTASVAALAAAKVCHDARAALARRLPDPVVAVAEDALAIGLAAVGSA